MNPVSAAATTLLQSRAPRTLRVVQYQLVIPRRELTAEEQKSVRHYSNRLLPDLLEHLGTPLPRTLSSPHKAGLATFLVTAGMIPILFQHAVGLDKKGRLKSLENSKLSESTLWKMFSGVSLGVGLISGVSIGLLRHGHNQDTLEIMRRLPPGATLLDANVSLLGEAQVRQDRRRKSFDLIARPVAHFSRLGQEVLASLVKPAGLAHNNGRVGP